MGEAKRRQLVEDVTKKLADDGKLLEAGWNGFRALYLQGAQEAQVNDMRIAFYAGAQHIYGSMMSFMEAGEQPTETDMRRVEALDQEVSEFIEWFKLHIERVEGNA
jgi:hypothetical protein